MSPTPTDVLSWIAQLQKAPASRMESVLAAMSVDALASTMMTLSDHYYNNDPLVSDAVFDQLRERLEHVAPKHPSLAAVGATIRSERAKATLPYRMGSLDKLKAEDAQVQARLHRWTKQFPGPYVVSQKLDGSSCLLVWRRPASGTGAWIPTLYTRGDGAIGVNISHLAPYLLPKEAGAQIPSVFPGVDEVALRGELLIRRDVFQAKYAAMARPRSLVNGLVNRKEVQREVAKDVDFVFYEVVAPRLAKQEQFRSLRELRLPVANHTVYATPPSAQTLEEELRRARTVAEYDMDGLVIEANGPYPLSTDRTPEYALAFKVAEDAVTTQVTGVVWAASKDGLWKPTIQYEPVMVAGTLLRNATGFHGQFVRDHGLGPGAIIKVGLGGDVIPQVLEVVQSASEPQFPPAGDYAWDPNGVEIRLTAAAAEKTLEYRRAQLQHFVTTLQIPHLNAGTLVKLQDAGIDTIPALISVQVATLAALPGLGNKSAQRILDGLREKTHQVPLARLMAASNTFGRGFAEKRLQLILDAFPDLMKQTPTTQALCTIDGIEAKTATKFLEGLPAFQAWLTTVPGITWVHAPARVKPAVPDGPWKNQVVVFTGFRSEALQQALEQRGATVADNVSKKTTVLVSKDGDPTSTKAKKAVEVGARILSRQALEAELSM